MAGKTNRTNIIAKIKANFLDIPSLLSNCGKKVDAFLLPHFKTTQI